GNRVVAGAVRRGPGPTLRGAADRGAAGAQLPDAAPRGAGDGKARAPARHDLEGFGPVGPHDGGLMRVHSQRPHARRKTFGHARAVRGRLPDKVRGEPKGAFLSPHRDAAKDKDRLIEKLAAIMLATLPDAKRREVAALLGESE